MPVKWHELRIPTSGDAVALFVWPMERLSNRMKCPMILLILRPQSLSLPTLLMHDAGTYHGWRIVAIKYKVSYSTADSFFSPFLSLWPWGSSVLYSIWEPFQSFARESVQSWRHGFEIAKKDLPWWHFGGCLNCGQKVFNTYKWYIRLPRAAEDPQAQCFPYIGCCVFIDDDMMRQLA